MDKFCISFNFSIAIFVAILAIDMIYTQAEPTLIVIMAGLVSVNFYFGMYGILKLK
jgi:uncharacterized membrane protein